METRVSSWWHETSNLYLRYLVAGASSIPAGLVYAYLAVNGLDLWRRVVVLLVVGLGSAALGWRISHRFFARQAVPTPRQAPASVNVFGVGQRVATVTVVASFVVLSAQPPQLSAQQAGHMAGIDHGGALASSDCTTDLRSH
jgi:hypothetical protein